MEFVLLSILYISAFFLVLAGRVCEKGGVEPRVLEGASGGVSIFVVVSLGASIAVYFSMLVARSVEAGGDLEVYYNWYQYAADSNSIDELREFHHDVGFMVLLKCFSFFISSDIGLDVFVFVCVFLFVCMLRLLGYSWATLSIFLLLLLPCRYFLDYSSNGIRSLVAAMFVVCSFLCFQNNKKYISGFLGILSCVIHVKLAVLYLGVVAIVFFVPFALLRFFFLCIPLLFVVKALFPGAIGFLHFIDVALSVLDPDLRDLARVAKAPSAAGLSASLAFQFLTYVLLPVIYLWEVAGKDRRSDKYLYFIVTTVFVCLVFYPEVSVAERFLYFTVPLILLRVASLVDASMWRDTQGFALFLFLVLVNVVSIRGFSQYLYFV